MNVKKSDETDQVDLGNNERLSHSNPLPSDEDTRLSSGRVHGNYSAPVIALDLMLRVKVGHLVSECKVRDLPPCRDP